MSDKVSLKKYYYYSRTAKRDTPVNVYLPANYDESKKYPVLYILHGYWDTEDWMTQPDVGLESSLNAMPVTGIAKEMIVVIPYILSENTDGVRLIKNIEVKVPCQVYHFTHIVL